jgi:hypothetical protein
MGLRDEPRSRIGHPARPSRDLAEIGYRISGAG